MDREFPLHTIHNISRHEINRIVKKSRHLIASNTKLSYCNNKHIKFKSTDQVSDQLYMKKVMLSAAASLVLSSKPNSS